MAWQKSWKKLTHSTYGLLHSVHLASSIDLGNIARIERSLSAARCWTDSSLGFVSAARKRVPKKGQIHFSDAEVDGLVTALRSGVIEVLLLSTTSVVEVLLADLLVSRGVATSHPGSFSASIEVLRRALSTRGVLVKHQWAITSLHEMRILRNCIVHSTGEWSGHAAAEFAKRVGSPQPQVGTPIRLSLDDLFSYRSASRTALGLAADC